MNNLKKLGYSDWFKNKEKSELMSIHSAARITSVSKNNFTLSTGKEDVFAELSGNLLYRSDSALDLPTTGDWVYADFYDEGSHAIIIDLFPRKTLLKRKSAGKRIDYQLIAANIDTALIIQSLNENFNLRRLERYLVMINESGIEPVILLSKCDLLSKEEVLDYKKKVVEIAPGTTVLAFSNLDKDNIDAIIGLLKSERTYCLLGSSGVGKTTLLNSIIGQEKYHTKIVSKKQSKGQHTTTNRQLVCLKNGALIIDTPGMRELGNLTIDDGLEETFSEIRELTKKCKFSNCSHTNETGCAVVAAINAGNLAKDRFKNYLKMKKESEFNDMSYIEKRKKDKAFGKFIKANKKNKGR